MRFSVKLITQNIEALSRVEVFDCYLMNGFAPLRSRAFEIGSLENTSHEFCTVSVRTRRAKLRRATRRKAIFGSKISKFHTFKYSQISGFSNCLRAHGRFAIAANVQPAGRRSRNVLKFDLKRAERKRERGRESGREPRGSIVRKSSTVFPIKANLVSVA